MNIDYSFLQRVLVALIVIGLVSSYPIMSYASHEFIVGSIIGGALATINVILGYAAIEYSYDKSTTVFFKYVLGGMGIRMLALASAIVLCIKVLQINIIGLITGLGICYLVFLVLEVLFIQKKVSLKHQ